MGLPQTNDEALVTGEELLRRPDLEPCELVNGKIVPMTPTGADHGEAEINVAFHLKLWATTGRHGRVMTGEVGVYIRRNPDTVRAADALFISHERFARRQSGGYLDVAPELVVEILSPDDRWTEVQAKLSDYFFAGVDRVWVIDPRTRKVFVHRSSGPGETLEMGQTLVDDDLLPGFSLPVAEIFA